MTAAAQRQHEEKTYRDNSGENNERKLGSKALKQEIVLKAFIVKIQ